MSGVTAGQVTTAREALDLVRPGATVVAGSLAAEPRTLMAELARRAKDVGGVTLLSGMLLSDYGFLAEPDCAIRYQTWFMPGSLRGQRLNPEVVDFLPLAWSQVMTTLETMEIDAALVQVSPRDDDGFYSLGVSVGYTLPAARRARHVIAEVNPNMPRTAGASRLHESEIDAVVPVDYPLPVFPLRPADEAGRQIAREAAALIEDGSTVQPGIGAIPSELMALLDARGTRVTIHSMITDACIGLVRAAVRRGDLPAAKVGEVIGSEAVYEFVHENDAVVMCDGRETHGWHELAAVDRLVAVNSALEVDLFGQANGEILDGVQAGGVGGSLDFMVAASHPGNLSLLLLRATTGGGAVSRIVPRLNTPVVSIPRSLVQQVITEHGTADLRGRTVEERARALIAVAAPQHREQLESAWREMRR